MFSCSPTCKIEVPERLTVSHETLVRTGLADRCVSVPVREATEAEILLAHRSSYLTLVMKVWYSLDICFSSLSCVYFAPLNSEEYLEAVKKTPYMSLEDLMEFTRQYGDVYFHPVSLPLNSWAKEQKICIWHPLLYVIYRPRTSTTVPSLLLVLRCSW